METSFFEVLTLFIVFFSVNGVLLVMIFKKKFRPAPLILKDKKGNRYRVAIPGTMERENTREMRE
ncbi:MAG: hypothetical protein HUN04_20045 [Desulfobacter sp.]|nr:MAG: hypothetical protein HUN04_20045 [Desulfobacter sp.]